MGVPIAVERNSCVSQHPEHESDRGGVVAVDAQQAALLRGLILVPADDPGDDDQVPRATGVRTLQFHSLPTAKAPLSECNSRYM